MTDSRAAPQGASPPRCDTSGALDEQASKALLASHGIAIPKGLHLAPGDAVPESLHGLHPPLALKLAAAGVTHKSDLGGVRLGLRDASAVQQAMREMSRDALLHGVASDGYLLEEMAPKGHEMVIGGLIDPCFGPVVMTGLGGVFVEVYADVAFRICPITRRDALDMIGELRAVAVLAGARGGIAADLEALADALLRVGGTGGLLLDPGCALRELDINPLIVSDRGAVAVDARIILA